ncbi:transposase family protein [Streptococcus pneumoniae]|nr:transposase family protein [Streptococcus pneumoniae]VNW87421.1 transposase family protein [Streptococcus pneumoniae]
MNEFLQQSSAYYSDDYLILVMDSATWYKSQALELPENITCTFIPPYTPEMNPIEQVQTEIRKRGFKNKAFKSLEEVILKLETVIQNLKTDRLRRIVHRKWTCPE